MKKFSLLKMNIFDKPLKLIFILIMLIGSIVLIKKHFEAELVDKTMASLSEDDFEMLEYFDLARDFKIINELDRKE